MKFRNQRSGVRDQESGVRSQGSAGRPSDLQTFRPSTARRRAGFTLVEVLLAVSVSVMVFAAMGMLLSKCFTLWKDATASWRLAQVTRISRERILSGGFANPAVGLLCATNVTISLDSGWNYIQYATVAGSGLVEQIRGWTGADADKDIQLRSGLSGWVYAQSIGSTVPPVKVDSFSASVTNKMVTLSYRLHFSAAGKTFTQPHTINAYLVNKE